MGTRLHVGNLPAHTSKGSLRDCFADYGEVSDVSIVAEQQNGHAKSAALITMSTENGAQHAIARLDGAILGGRVLEVKLVDEPSAPGRGNENDRRRGRGEDRASAARAKSDAKSARITLQFRERHNMTYELDCSGIPLIVRIFFPLGDGPPLEWHVEARTSDAPGAAVATATAASRSLALRSIAQWWQDNRESQGLSTLDWEGVERAMAEVRAL